MTNQPPVAPLLDFRRIGPAVGDPFPDVTVPNQFGEPVDLHTWRAGRRALVVFYRSAAW
jgi:peroxiredoxin